MIWAMYTYIRADNNKTKHERYDKIQKKILRMTSFSAHVTTGDLSVVRISQMINPNTELDITIFF